MELNCEQLGLDNGWSLTRLNSCHIGVQNKEMGEVRDEMAGLRTEVTQQVNDIRLDISTIAQYQNMTMWFNGILTIAIVGSLVGIAVKKIFGNNK